jgi:hypothetical protein
MATSGDLHVAINEDFPMAMDRGYHDRWRRPLLNSPT